VWLNSTSINLVHILASPDLMGRLPLFFVVHAGGRVDLIRLLAAYSLLWWPPGRTCLVRDCRMAGLEPDRRTRRHQATRRPVITRRVQSGQCSLWRSDSITPLDTYSLLWWPAGRAYLVRYLPKDRPRCRFDLGFSFVVDFVNPVVRGRFGKPSVPCGRD
jgi:hypothetical protein